MALTITVNISDEDQKALENDLLDINDWVQKAVIGKINNCGKRMAVQATEVLKADEAVSNMPATNPGLITALAARPDYKNRAEREAAKG
jgi:hypothetical protein